MTHKVSIVTWNVNSIRARLHTVDHFVSKVKPDIVLLQETKCLDKDFPQDFFSELGYNTIFSGQKSYNGVAILSKYQISLEKTTLIENDQEMRYIEGTFSIDKNIFRVSSVYVPQGASNLETKENLENSKRFLYKLDFLKQLSNRMAEISKFDEIVIFGGDLNVAHHDIDLHNPKAFKNTVCFHPMEQKFINNIIKSGYNDTFRKLYPNKTEYTWWDYRRNGYQSNRGWRVDYIFSNQVATNLIQDCIIHKEIRGLEKPSDHVPVEVLIGL